MKLLKTTKQEILLLVLLVLVSIAFIAKLNERDFTAGLMNAFIIAALYIYFSKILKTIINPFFKVIIFFFFSSSVIHAFNDSNFYVVTQFYRYLPQGLLLGAYFGLIHCSLMRLKFFKFRDIANVYLMLVLLVNIILTVIFVELIIDNVTEVLQKVIIYIYCVISITLGFTSFATFNQDGLKESFLFTAMALGFIFSDTQYTLNNFFMPSIIFEIGDIILTATGLFFMFRYLYEKQVVAEELRIEKIKRLEARAENKKLEVESFAIRL